MTESPKMLLPRKYHKNRDSQQTARVASPLPGKAPVGAKRPLRPPPRQTGPSAPQPVRGGARGAEAGHPGALLKRRGRRAPRSSGEQRPRSVTQVLGSESRLRKTEVKPLREEYVKIQLKIAGFKCPVCSKFVSSDEMDLHLVMCLTKPRITYNEDVLSKDAGECAICLEELQQGDTIARLPCLCIYHKGCIDEWFEVNRSCPEHPSD
ncbi:PREDICTED: E3 ubiquitin-protein ligase ZNRF2 [Nipponia nippon]|uniref:E3 ubiquitin-protein ligase ZNRF2 n=1 Tax=Nipponia nippon TaxID=128390 RepID=UPI0005115A81|nr:PREDICTED: E3 ubiquitin-protein ligase ZNRF2 [Nipponia nippon]